jgi:hypothetical protein
MLDAGWWMVDAGCDAGCWMVDYVEYPASSIQHLASSRIEHQAASSIKPHRASSIKPVDSGQPSAVSWVISKGRSTKY